MTPALKSVDDTYNLCSHQIQVTNFPPIAGFNVNGYYQLLTEDDIDGEALSGRSSHLTNGRGVYKAMKSYSTIYGRNKRNCIWWHKKYGHWWLGECQNRGLNVGSLYLGPFKTCPQDGLEGQWREAGTDRVLKEGNVIKAV